jgi:hypothetical protein
MISYSGSYFILGLQYIVLKLRQDSGFAKIVYSELEEMLVLLHD